MNAATSTVFTNSAMAGAPIFRPTARRRRAMSSFEFLSASCAPLPDGIQDVLGVLLMGTIPPAANARWSARPIWVEEALHRACGTLRLILRLHQAGRREREGWAVEHVLASEITDAVRSLATGCEFDQAPCSRILRDVVRNTVSLFEPAFGDVDIVTVIEPVTMPAYRRRALVLLAVELVMNALLHAFAGRPGGLIKVALQKLDERHAFLQVSDDGTGIGERIDPDPGSVACGLARVLDAPLVYWRGLASPTIAEIAFRTSPGLMSGDARATARAPAPVPWPGPCRRVRGSSGQIPGLS